MHDISSLNISIDIYDQFTKNLEIIQGFIQTIKSSGEVIRRLESELKICVVSSKEKGNVLWKYY